MTVDEFHTYFVSELSIWVHDANGCIDLNYLKNYGNEVEWHYVINQRKDFISKSFYSWFR